MVELCSIIGANKLKELCLECTPRALRSYGDTLRMLDLVKAVSESESLQDFSLCGVWPQCCENLFPVLSSLKVKQFTIGFDDLGEDDLHQYRFRPLCTRLLGALRRNTSFLQFRYLRTIWGVAKPGFPVEFFETDNKDLVKGLASRNRFLPLFADRPENVTAKKWNSLVQSTAEKSSSARDFAFRLLQAYPRPQYFRDCLAKEVSLVQQRRLEESAVVLMQRQVRMYQAKKRVEYQQQHEDSGEAEFDAEIYRERNRIERFFGRLKASFRRIATRYEKTSRNFMSMIKLASVRLWIEFYESAA